MTSAPRLPATASTSSAAHSLRPGLLVALMCAAQLLNVANISSVNLAVPAIAADLDIAAANLPWVVSAYLVTFAGSCC